jgi:hypothetical protein
MAVGWCALVLIACSAGEIYVSVWFVLENLVYQAQGALFFVFCFLRQKKTATREGAAVKVFLKGERSGMPLAGAGRQAQAGAQTCMFMTSV